MTNQNQPKPVEPQVEQQEVQHQVLLHADYLLTEENKDIITQGVSNFCGRLSLVNRNIDDHQGIVPLACELYMNFASIDFANTNKGDEAKAIVEEGKKGYSLAVLGLQDTMQDANTSESTLHQALAVCINDDTKMTLVNGEYANGEMGEVQAKGIVLVSFDPILPVHFSYLLLEHTSVSLSEEGVSAMVIVDAKDNMEILAIPNKDILSQVAEYKVFRDGLSQE